MNYYFKLSEPSDDDVIETDDYLEHAASKNPDNQLYVFDRVWKDSEGHWRVDLKNTVTGATATKIGIDPKYEGKPLSFNAVKSVVRYALNNHKIAIKDSEVDKIVYTFMRLAPQFFTETGRSTYTINRGESKNPKKSTSTLSPQYLKHSVTIDSTMCAVVPAGEELAHYGVEGMKWGVRRYQNADGSLTPEGKIHYSKGGDDQRGGLVTAAIVLLFPAVAEAAIVGIAAAASSAEERAKKKKEDKREKEAEKELFGEGKDHGLTLEDLKKVNPKFGEKGYTSNCPKCSTVLELRKRGMDVTAKSGSGQTDTEMASWFKGAKPMKDLHVDSAEEKIKEMPAGASGFISGAWPRGFGGHVVHWTNIGNGTIRIEDGQNGKVYTWDQFKEKYPFQEDRYCVTRLDNCAINEQKMKDAGVYTEYKEEEKKK